MSRYLIAACAALALSGCVAVHADVRTDTVTANALLTARPHDCPADRMRADARTSSPGGSERIGVIEEEVALSPLTALPGHFVRMRRIIVAPGGVLPWHNHDGRQGLGTVLSGNLVEYRNSCLDPIHHSAGDIVREVAGLAHGWRNESDQTAVILATDVYAPPPR